MNSKATPIEQDPFAMRRAGRLIALWAETLPKPVAPDGAHDADIAKDGVRYRLKAKPANAILIDADSYYPSRFKHTEDRRAHYRAQVEQVQHAAEALGLIVEIVPSRQSASDKQREREARVALDVRLPEGNEAGVLAALFANMPKSQMDACVANYTKMPSLGEGVFSVEMLLNPYDSSQLVNKEVATRVLAIRSRSHINEREPLEQFAEKYGITQAVKALGRGGNRELGA